MKRVTLTCALVVLLCAAPNAFAQGGAAQCQQPVKLQDQQRVSSLTLPKGSYHVNVQETGEITCDQARQYFREILAAPGGTLPAGWQVELASQTFARKDGSNS